MPSSPPIEPANTDLQPKIDIVEAGLTNRVVSDPTTEYIVEKRWVQSISRQIPAPLSNRIWFSVLSEAEADERIDRTIAFYKSLQLPLVWMVSPSSRPVDLPARLMNRGFQLMGRVRGMVANVDALVEMPEIDEQHEIHVEPLRPSELNLWVDLIADGWKMLPEAREAMHAKMKRRLIEDQDKIIYVLARVGDVPCGAAFVELHQEFGLLMSGLVVPEFRRRGVYRAMVKTRAKLLQERNRRYAVIHALETSSAPIARAMGFEDVCEIVAYCLS